LYFEHLINKLQYRPVKSNLWAIGPRWPLTALDGPRRTCDGSRRTRNVRTIGYGIRCLGWRQVQTKYCQIVDPINRLKRFIYCCFYKSYQEDFFDTIDVDETSVEIKFSSYSNYRKPGLLGPAGGKKGKPKHNFKVHLFGGISRQGLTPLIIFTGIMYTSDLQSFLSASILPFIRRKFPYGHRFFMDNDPKNTSHSFRRFIILNNINHFETPPQSPDLMPI
jgi:hypothetical protein